MSVINTRTIYFRFLRSGQLISFSGTAGSRSRVSGITHWICYTMVIISMTQTESYVVCMRLSYYGLLTVPQLMFDLLVLKYRTLLYSCCCCRFFPFLRYKNKMIFETMIFLVARLLCLRLPCICVLLKYRVNFSFDRMYEIKSFSYVVVGSRDCHYLEKQQNLKKYHTII